MQLLSKKKSVMNRSNIRKEAYTMLPSLQLQLEMITLEQYENLPENRRVEVFENVVYDILSFHLRYSSTPSALSWLFLKQVEVRIISVWAFTTLTPLAFE